MMEANGYDAAERLDHFHAQGFVYSDPDCFILAEWDGPVLFIWLAIGRNFLQRFIEIAPPGLERIAFERGVRGQTQPRFYNFERLTRLCHSKRLSLSPRPLRFRPLPKQTQKSSLPSDKAG